MTFILSLGVFSAFFEKQSTRKKLNILINQLIDIEKSLNSSRNTNSSIIPEIINKSVCFVMVFYNRDANTMEQPGELEKDENSTLDYQVTLDQTTTNKSRGLVLKITRKLETGDPQDVPITVS